MQSKIYIFLVCFSIACETQATRFKDYLDSIEAEKEAIERSEPIRELAVTSSKASEQTKPIASNLIDMRREGEVIFDSINSDASHTKVNGVEKNHFVSITPNLKMLSFSTVKKDSSGEPIVDSNGEMVVDYDYYHVKASGWLHPFNKKAKQYSLHWSIEMPPNVSVSQYDDAMRLEAITPSTHISSTKLTTTLQMKLSTSIANSSSQVGGDIEWNQTKERIVKDMEIGTRVKDFMPGWNFFVLNKSSTIAKSGFNYDCEWVWRINRPEASSDDLGIYKEEGGIKYFEVKRTLKVKYFGSFIFDQEDEVKIRIPLPDVKTKKVVTINVTEENK